MNGSPWRGFDTAPGKVLYVNLWIQSQFYAFFPHRIANIVEAKYVELIGTISHGIRPFIPKGLRHAAQGCESDELPWVGLSLVHLPCKGLHQVCPYPRLPPMPQSLAKTLVRGIFSTKDRRPFL